MMKPAPLEEDLAAPRVDEQVDLDLTFTKFNILHLLASRPGWVSSRAQIVDAVRGYDYHVTERSVDVHIVGLRRKLGDARSSTSSTTRPSAARRGAM